MIKYEVTVANPTAATRRITWRVDGQLHCEHGPAVVDTSLGLDYELWYKDGHLHCEHGAAVRGSRFGPNEFRLNGVQYNEEDFKKRLKKKNSCDGDVITHKGKKYKLTLVESE